MNERLKELRRSLGLSMEVFGERIGLSKTSISRMEAGELEVSERTVKAMCLAFHVREQWLRTGEGEMYEPDAPADETEAFIKAKGMSSTEAEIFRIFVNMPDDLREALLRYFEKHIDALAATLHAPPDEAEGSSDDEYR